MVSNWQNKRFRKFVIRGRTRGGVRLLWILWIWQAISTSAKSKHWDVAIGVLGSMVFKAWLPLLSSLSMREVSWRLLSDGLESWHSSLLMICYDMLWYLAMSAMNFCMCQYVCFQHLPAFLRGCPGCPSTCAGHSRHHQLQFRHQWPLESSVSVGRDGRSWNRSISWSSWCHWCHQYHHACDVGWTWTGAWFRITHGRCHQPQQRHGRLQVVGNGMWSAPLNATEHLFGYLQQLGQTEIPKSHGKSHRSSPMENPMA